MLRLFFLIIILCLGQYSVVTAVITPLCALEHKSQYRNPPWFTWFTEKKEVKGPRVAIGFYGLSRSVGLTFPSIEKHVFNVLDRQNIAYDVFSHTLSANTIDNQQSEEEGALDKFDVRLLRPCYVSMLYQEEIREKEFNLYLRLRNLTHEEVMRAEEAEKHLPADLWKDNFASVKNVLCAYHSLQGLHKLIMSVSRHSNIKYDAIMVLRPDTAQLIDTDIFHNLQEIMSSRTVFIPDFQHLGGYNDRMAYGSADAMSVYMNRGYEFLHGISPTTGEIMLQNHLKTHNVAVKFSNMRCIRVRLDGDVPLADTLRANMNISNNYPFEECVKDVSVC